MTRCPQSTFSVMAVCSFVFATAMFCSAQTKDAKGCQDSPLITRFPGSIIASCQDRADDIAELKMKGPSKKIEGEVHRLAYTVPPGASHAQLVRNLNTALHNAGYTFDYDSGAHGDFTAHSNNTWIMVEVSGDNFYRVTTVKETKLTQDVVANAAALSGGLLQNGHAVVPGIYFDTAKAVLKPESAAALQEVAKLFQSDPKLKLYVVGHTDNEGQLASNMELSKQRAAAVVKALTTQYGVAASRVQPYGDGPYAPVASNDTEDGRALNRRVELVKQ
jgi:OmpA-OmpF porin, OOP family